MKNQIFAALTVNLHSLTYGISNGWISPNLVSFQTDDSPIGRITQSEAALIVSSLCVGGLLGSIIFGFLADWCGRKKTIVWMALPQILASVLLLFGTHPHYVYMARFFYGLSGGGVFTVLPIFVSEISQESIRGALGTLLSFNWTTGIVIGYVLASWMDYFLVPYVPLAFSVLFLVIFLWLPESPDYLLHTNQLDLAKISYAFYENHRSVTQPPPPPLSTNGGVGGGLCIAEDSDADKFAWSDFKHPAVRRGCYIAFTLIFFADTCGVFTITNYMTELLQLAHIEIDVYVATVALGVLQIIGVIISIFCMDRYGRRALFLASALFSSLAMYVFGLYYYILTDGSYAEAVAKLQWLPIASLAVAILGVSLAIAAAPYFMIAELLPMKLRSRVSTMALCMSWVLAFAVIHSFHQLVNYVGVQGAYWLYASICMAEVFYIYFCLPETKNLTIEQIQEKLVNGNAKR